MVCLSSPGFAGDGSWQLYFCNNSWLNSQVMQCRDGETGSQQDEETKVMTLDEWKSMEEAKRVKAEFNIRKPGEGCSGDPQWKKMFMLTKKEKSETHDDDEDQQVELFCSLVLLLHLVLCSAEFVSSARH